jgi:hypothetical protein
VVASVMGLGSYSSALARSSPLNPLAMSTFPLLNNVAV